MLGFKPPYSDSLIIFYSFWYLVLEPEAKNIYKNQMTPTLLYYAFLTTCVFIQSNNGMYTVGDFMTKKEELHTVKPTTTVDEGAF